MGLFKMGEKKISPELYLYVSINSCLAYATCNHKIMQVSEITLLK